jgi:hypothetical protein
MAEPDGAAAAGRQKVCRTLLNGLLARHCNVSDAEHPQGHLLRNLLRRGLYTLLAHTARKHTRHVTSKQNGSETCKTARNSKQNGSETCKPD